MQTVILRVWNALLKIQNVYNIRTESLLLETVQEG